MKTKKYLAYLLILILTTTTLGYAAVAQNEEVVRMWTFLDPSNTGNGRSIALNQMIEGFQAENPGVKVVVEPQDYNVMSAKFLAAHATNDAPDIIWLTQDMLGTVRDAGALEPFENLFLKDWTEEDIADIDDLQWQWGVKDGLHYQVTLCKNIVTLYYRADLFEQEEIEIPTTWDELVAAAQKLTGVDEETGMMRYGLGMSFSTESSDAALMSNMIVAKQGSLFKDNGAANWANDIGKEALQWQIDCIETYGITPIDAITSTNEDLFTEFYAGKYAMIIGGAVRVPNVKKAATFDPDAVQIFLVPGDGSTPYSPCLLNGWFVGVWSNSTVKESAGKFVEYMINSQSDELWVVEGGQAPLRASTTENNQEFFQSLANKYLTVMATGFKQAGWMMPDDAAVVGWVFDLNRAMQYVMVEGMTVEEALETTAEEFNDRNGY